MNSTENRIHTAILWLAVTVPAGLALWTAIASLSWSYVHDFPLLHYAAWTFAEQDLRPYADLFEFNFPGTYLFHLAMGAVAGWDPLGVRWFDLGWLAVTLGAASWALRRFGRGAMIATASFVSLDYLARGAMQSLQREWILMAPLFVALGLAMTPGAPRRRRSFGLGLAVGVAAMIKPPVAPLLGLFLLFEALRPRDPDLDRGARVRRGLLHVAVAAGGFLIPVAVGFGWVAAVAGRDGLAAFTSILRDYAPLYTAMTGWHEVLDPGQRPQYLVKQLLSRPETFVAIAAGLAPLALLFFSRETRSHRRVAGLLAATLLTAALYPLIPGKFWPYHFIPLETLSVAMLGVVFVGLETRLPRRLRSKLVIAACVVLLARSGLAPPPAPDVARTEAVATYLRENRREGETVQPLDWTGGMVHAMLRARAPIATSTMYDFMFHHHVSTPFIQRHRESFLERLEAAKPRFVLRLAVPKRPKGADTDPTFAELDAYLAAHYRPAPAGIEGVEILERQ